MDTSAAGKTFPPYEFHVERGKIREFAAAVGDPNPVYRDPAAVNQLNPHLHNVPVQIAAERGLPALAVWLLFVFVLVRDLVRQRRTVPFAFLPNAGLAIVAAMMTAGMFEYNFGDSEFLMLFLLLVTLPYAAARSVEQTA